MQDRCPISVRYSPNGEAQLIDRLGNSIAYLPDAKIADWLFELVNACASTGIYCPEQLFDALEEVQQGPKEPINFEEFPWL